MAEFNQFEDDLRYLEEELAWMNKHTEAEHCYLEKLDAWPVKRLLNAVLAVRKECASIYNNSVDDKVGMAGADIGKLVGLNLND